MTHYTATYSPDDNKLRLYASSRLDKDLYTRVRAAGFIWAPKQDLFVAPSWTPEREDLLIELAGCIDDEDSSLVDRASERAERFEEYSEHRADDAENARKYVASIADNIPPGQPILVGHHSERHARKDAERIENGMRKAVKMWETSKYWEDRARAAIGHAKYKERPDVRARRIKGLEADQRKLDKQSKDAALYIKRWSNLDAFKRSDGSESTPRERAMYVANHDYCSLCFPLADYPRDPPASQYEGSMSLWSALDGYVITADQAAALAIRMHERGNAIRARWATHLANRLAYERAMLADAGGTVADRTGPEVGGGCRCWASPRRYDGGWSYIKKVNKVSVTVLDNWGNGGANFTRTIPLDKLTAIMSRADVDAAKANGLLIEIEDRGFVLANTPPKAPREPKPEPTDFDAMRASLAAGVKVVSAPQLFPTPRELARRMVDLASIEPGHAVLEPSAGTGSLLGAMGGRMFGHNPERGAVTAVELNAELATKLQREFPLTNVIRADFLNLNGEIGTFDRIVMNPPFENAADIAHIKHARAKLRPGGLLVAICANGPRQQAQLQPLTDSWEPLPNDTFDGTHVNAVLLTMGAA